MTRSTPHHLVFVAVVAAVSPLAACGPPDSAAPGTEHRVAATSSVATTAASHPVSLGSIKYPVEWDAAVEVPPPDPDVVEESLPQGDDIVDVAEWLFDSGEPLTFPSDVLFGTDSIVLSSAADALLADFATAAKAQLGEGESLEVHGWVDDRGTPAHNAALAQGRADAVVARLLRLFPELDGRVVAVGHPENDLLDRTCPGDCPRNRAVTVVVLSADQ